MFCRLNLSSFQLGPPGKSLDTFWGPSEKVQKRSEMVPTWSTRFTDGGTLHALCLTSPLLNAPEKVQKRSGSRCNPAKIQKRSGRRLAQKRSGSCLKKLETVWEPLKQFRNGLGATRKGSETAPNDPKGCQIFAFTISALRIFCLCSVN